MKVENEIYWVHFGKHRVVSRHSIHSVVFDNLDHQYHFRVSGGPPISLTQREAVPVLRQLGIEPAKSRKGKRDGRAAK